MSWAGCCGFARRLVSRAYWLQLWRDGGLNTASELLSVRLSKRGMV